VGSLLEIIIETVSWIIGILLLLFLVPKEKTRLAFLSILVMQAITWPLGFITVELRLLSYPVRFFDYATTSSFTFEYFLFPIVSALFTIYYPKKPSFLRILIYTSAIVSSITLGEVILEKYTDTIEYLHWEWYWSWISMFIVLHIAKKLTNQLTTV